MTAAAVLGAPAAARADGPAGAAAVRQIETAHRVAEWGRERGDAQALLVAAQMLGSVETRAADDDGVIEQDGSRPVPAPAPPPAPPPSARATKPAREEPAKPLADKRPPRETTVESLLDEAQRLARGDPAIRARIAARRASAAKGVSSSTFGLGPLRVTRDIPARAVWRLELVARGGEPLRVVAIGDGDTDVDIEIRDAEGRLVCDDRTAGHYASCGFTPPFEGRYTARIVNRGLLWTRATVVSN